jgi:hypothetical protein
LSCRCRLPRMMLRVLVYLEDAVPLHFGSISLR